MQDVASYEATQETLALLKDPGVGKRQVEEGKVVRPRRPPPRPREDRPAG